MASYDPLLKREYWVFHKVGIEKGLPLYRRAAFNLVSYDGDPELMVEPINVGYLIDPVTPNTQIINNMELDNGAIAGFLFIDSQQLYEVQAFGSAGPDTV